MRYLTFGKTEGNQYEVALLVPRLQSDDIRRYYIDPYLSDIEDSVIAYSIYKEPKRTPVKLIKEYLSELLPTLADLGVKYLIVTDGEYFKALTKAGKVDANLGYVLDSELGNFKVLYCPNYAQVFYDPDKVQAKITQAFFALNEHRQGTYTDPGNSVIHFAAYPKTVKEIGQWLQRLIDMDCDLTADIECFSLKHYDAGIGTITFCWNQHEGVAFPVDFLDPKDALEVRKMLKIFFENFERKMIWHNVSFDVYVLIYQLFMDDILDQEGLLYGLEVMLKNWDCTKLITYLATNSCAGNKLGLKDQAQEFAGNYAVEEIKDIRKIPLDELLQYNLVDGLSTWFVHNKHYQTVFDDQQDKIYEGLFKDAIVDIIQMQLTGMPVDMQEVEKANKQLRGIADNAIHKMRTTNIIQEFTEHLRWKWREKKHATWKKKRIDLADVPVTKETTFNPNSAPQLQALLYEQLKLPVIDKTDTGLPATGKETLEKLKNHTTEQEEIDFIDALIDYSNVAIIISNFLPHMLAAVKGPDGWHYLFGNFNLGGTVSGRLSSNNPNLQNLPASAWAAKIIKACFKAPPGWLFVGLDFASLEDRISALTTKDPQKLKVYTDGYDGHCLRAYAYFGDQMPDIDPTTVSGINEIKDKYPGLRGKSKSPTFALTYQGTYHTLMSNCGFSQKLAQDVEEKYHKLYVVSDQWVEKQLDQACKDGYVTCAFGLRVRTPLLKQVIRGTNKTPYEAQAEGRTAGNALGQSWCLLNSRAASEFMRKVRKSLYRLTIRPCAHIHDAQYYLIKDDLDHVQYVNTHLVKAVQWQNDPLIWHKDVKLGGELSIFYPNWSHELEIPNGASKETINEECIEHIIKLRKKGIEV